MDFRLHSFWESICPWKLQSLHPQQFSHLLGGSTPILSNSKYSHRGLTVIQFTETSLAAGDHLRM